MSELPTDYDRKMLYWYVNVAPLLLEGAIAHDKGKEIKKRFNLQSFDVEMSKLRDREAKQAEIDQKNRYRNLIKEYFGNERHQLEKTGLQAVYKRMAEKIDADPYWLTSSVVEACNPEEKDAVVGEYQPLRGNPITLTQKGIARHLWQDYINKKDASHALERWAVKGSYFPRKNFCQDWPWFRDLFPQK